MSQKWSDMPELPEFFDRYIKKVDDLPLNEAFELNTPHDIMADIEKLKALEDKIYAPEKWTVKDILQHIIDTERIMIYRALRFGRNDKTVLPGFEEDDFAKNTNVSNRTIDELMEEWESVRAGSRTLFKSFNTEMLQRTGETFASNISVLALGFVIIGHAKHHYQVIEERYFPMLTA
ncbi:DinB family protein [uncultured Arcticibacterium sp.]|uniref:DinB family protein n=1 Tax=uncultured Arcticibacterium sp. TaxID=2173042 RepID=UPI0030FBC7A6